MFTPSDQGKQGFMLPRASDRAEMLGWVVLQPSSAASKSEESSENPRRGRIGCSREGGCGGAGWSMQHQGSMSPGPLTSTRRPMLAMCGEQSLTVSSFSICKDTNVESRESCSSRLPPTHHCLALQSSAPWWLPLHTTVLCPLKALWSCVMLQGHFPSTND